MVSKTLAIQYRPQTWEDVTEQKSIKIILQQQLASGDVKNAYLFCGPAGCGKTTCARIFANDINNGQGNPIEMDAASNSGVDDVRKISEQAKLKSITSEYKVFIIDECHSISNTGWQAFLKLIEEPPAKSIFIFCTTDPQKIPKTILSRVQRYDFQKISQQGIVSRLEYILEKQGYFESKKDSKQTRECLDYIAKIAEGGMRDAISLMDKCLAYSDILTLENVVKALGTTDYEVMFRLTDAIFENNTNEEIRIVEDLYASGKDLKRFVNLYVQFLLDIAKIDVGCDWKYINVPKLPEYEKQIAEYGGSEFEICRDLLSAMVNLNSDIKYSNSPKYDLEACLMLFYEDR